METIAYTSVTSGGGRAPGVPALRQTEDDETRSATTGRPVVLIVDDIEDNLLALVGMLRRDDVEIVTALSGRAALEVLLERDVALAIIDVRMPEIDGFALAELMRGVAKTRYVPIIFVTAGSHEVSRVFQGYEAGAVDFLFKPLDEQILRSKVGVFVMLHRQRQQLVEAERMREMFVGILGHDLRNPLSGITMSAQIVLRRSQDDGVREPVQSILRYSERMTRLVEQLLDVTRIRLGGGIALFPVSADLRMIVEEVLGEMLEHKERFRFEVRGDARGTWDMDRLAQVISNLVGNAIHHGLPGTPVSILVDGRYEEDLAFEIRNSGSIPADLREEIFEPFRGRRRAGGIGLGLYVCKQFVAAHGGTIECESSDDAGTCFTVRLPRHSGKPFSGPLS